MFPTIALSAGVMALLAYPAFAHHPSGASSTGGAGPIATISATTLEKGQSAAGVVVEAIGLDPLAPEQLAGHPHPHSLEGIFATSLVYAYGVRLSVDKWSGFVSVGVPIVNDLNGIQPEAEWRLLTGVSVNF